MLTSINEAIEIPCPNQLFSFTSKAKEPPCVPIPAPALISPVAFSSTIISIIFNSLSDPVETSFLTEPNKPLDFNLDIEEDYRKLLRVLTI